MLSSKIDTNMTVFGNPNHLMKTKPGVFNIIENEVDQKIIDLQSNYMYDSNHNLERLKSQTELESTQMSKF
jgi:hypothetical protein